MERIRSLPENPPMDMTGFPVSMIRFAPVWLLGTASIQVSFVVWESRKFTSWASEAPPVPRMVMEVLPDA